MRPGHISRAGCADGYPLDLDASERVARLASTWSMHPFPHVTGYPNVNGMALNHKPFQGDQMAAPYGAGLLSGFLRLYDALIGGMAVAPPVYGPSSMPVVNLQYQVTVPGLFKAV